LKGGGAGDPGAASPPDAEEAIRAAEEGSPAEAIAGADITDDDLVILEGELLDAAAVAGLPELTELEVVTAERDEYLDALRRLRADFDNFRKRVRRQEEEGSAYHVASLVERLLPVLDALDLAASHAKAEDVAVFNQVGQLLRDVLAKEGVEKIDADGVPFEPTIHDAVAHVTASPDDGQELSGVDEPVVEEVLRTGYSMKGKVLRPAMVKVRG
jgi:molecular chaperone GrpE